MQVFILYFGFVYLQMKSSLYWLLSISQRIGRAVEFSRIHSLCAEGNYFLVGRNDLSTAYTSQQSNKVQLQDSDIYLR